jgi:hypothetical protein
MPLSFLDDKGPGTQHPGAGEPGSSAPAGEKKKEDHRQQLIAVATILGVIVAYLTYRSVKGGSSTASASGQTLTSASVPGASNGIVAGSGGNTDAINGFTSYLQNISGELTTLNGNLTNTQANSTSTLPATPSPTIVGDLQSYARANSPQTYQAYQAYLSNTGSAAAQQLYLTDVNDYGQANNVVTAAPGQTITAGLGAGTVQAA